MAEPRTMAWIFFVAAINFVTMGLTTHNSYLISQHYVWFVLSVFSWLVVALTGIAAVHQYTKQSE